MLFDVEADPHEVHDLSGDSRYATVLLDLRERLQRQVKSMPDLSFYPESYLVEHAFDAPVAFGQAHRQAIVRLVDIADLSLEPFEKSKLATESALSSQDPIERYWGLIVCSCFGQQAGSLTGRAIELTEDENLLVRTRAAEFLGIVGSHDPVPTIMECLSASQSGVQTNLILNTAVLLRDGYGYDFEISPQSLSPTAADYQDVRRRLSYFAAEDGVPQNPRGLPQK
jgi:hypothetical protein